MYAYYAEAALKWALYKSDVLTDVFLDVVDVGQAILVTFMFSSVVHVGQGIFVTSVFSLVVHVGQGILVTFMFSLVVHVVQGRLVTFMLSFVVHVGSMTVFYREINKFKLKNTKNNHSYFLLLHNNFCSFSFDDWHGMDVLVGYFLALCHVSCVFLACLGNGVVHTLLLCGWDSCVKHHVEFETDVTWRSYVLIKNTA